MNLKILASRISNVFTGHIDKLRDRFADETMHLSLKVQEAELEFDDAIALARRNNDRICELLEEKQQIQKKMKATNELANHVARELKESCRTVAVNLLPNASAGTACIKAADRIDASRGMRLFELSVSPCMYTKLFYLMDRSVFQADSNDLTLAVFDQAATEIGEAIGQNVKEQVLRQLVARINPKPAAEAK
jgi:hypothetical protein